LKSFYSKDKKSKTHVEMTLKSPYQETNIVDTKAQIMPHNKKILIFIVDDNPLFLKSMETPFNRNGNFSVKTFLTGEECIRSLDLKPDLVVLDYFLNSSDPDAMDGFKTLLLIKENSPGTQVIMVSSQESTELAVNCIKNGAFDYIAKNEKTFHRLKQSIKKVFSLYSVEKELILWDW
jgi:DNA-binding NtrC family response regulator